MTTRLTRSPSSTRFLQRVASFALLLSLAHVSIAEAGRFNLTLEDGATVVVIDNYSAYPDSHAANLAIGADRSTQEDGMLLSKERPDSGRKPHSRQEQVCGVVLRRDGPWLLDAEPGDRPIRIPSDGPQRLHRLVAQRNAARVGLPAGASLVLGHRVAGD